MALDVGRLVAYLEVDDSQFDATMSQSQSRWSRLGGFLASAARTVGVAAGAAVGAAGVVGLRTAANAEQASIAFSTMLGSGRQAQAFLGQLSAFAARTPFDLPGLQTAASSLISAGVDASRVIPIMTSLGNATSGMGTGAAGIQRATVALQQMNAAGKITGEDLNQLRDAGIPVYDLLAAATGRSKAKVAELAAQGKLGKRELQQLMTALADGRGLERFNGLMDKQSASLSGLRSTLKDTFSQGMSQAIAPAIPLLKQGLGGAITFIADNTPRLVAGMRAAVAFVTQFVAGFSSGGESLRGSGGQVAAWGQQAQLWFSRAGEALAGLFDGDLPGQLSQMATALSGFFSGLSSGAGGGAGVGTTLAGIGDSLGRLLPLLQQAGQQVGATFADGIRVSGVALGFLADNLDTLAALLPWIAAGFALMKAAQVASQAAAIAQLPIQAAQVASNFALASAVRASGAAANAAAIQQAAAASVTRASMLSTAATAVASAARVVGGWVLMGVQSMANAVRMAAAWVVAMGPVGWVIAGVVGLVALIIANWDKVRGATGAAWRWVTSFVSKVPGAIVAFFQRWTLLGVIVSHWDEIRRGVIAKAGQLLVFVAGLPAKIVSALGNLGPLLLDKGGELVSGLIEGISNAGGRLLEFVKRFIAEHIPGPIARALGIASPSTVAARLARWVPLGMIEGLKETGPQLKRAMADLATPPALRLPAGSLDSASASARRAAVASAGAAAGGAALQQHYHGDIYVVDPAQFARQQQQEARLAAAAYGTGAIASGAGVG